VGFIFFCAPFDGMVIVPGVFKKYLQTADGKAEIPDIQIQDQAGFYAIQKCLARPEDAQILQMSLL